jgi:CRP-like cAMP-binding protein
MEKIATHNPIIQMFHFINPLSEEIIYELDTCIESTTIKKGTVILDIGKIANRIYFIKKGVSRVYYYKNDIDVTDYFAVENQFIGAVKSFFDGSPSKKGIQVLEDSELYFIKNSDLERLSQKYHSIEKIGRKMLIFAFLESQERLEGIQFLSAKERLNELEKKYPGLLNRAPLKHIASYLGITQVSLSRIRAEY